LWQLAAAARGRRVPSFVSDYADAERFELSSARPFPVQIDGDDGGWTRRLEVRVEPAAIRVLAPSW
jgi:diacylglycerol kinase family enzyme